MSEQNEDVAFDAIFGDGAGEERQGDGTAGGGEPGEGEAGGDKTEGNGSASDGGNAGAGEAGGDDSSAESGKPEAGEAGGGEGDGSASDGGNAGADDAGDGETESERLKRLAAFAKTAEGRMAALEAENRRLREEQDALRAAAPNPQKPVPVEIPEELAADAKEFDALCPDCTAYLREPGARGDRLRKVLRDYGADRAAVMAEGFAVYDRTENELRAVRAEMQRRDAQAYLEHIAQAHPEMAGYASRDHVALEASQAYIAKVEAWIEGLPEQEKTAGKAALAKGSSYDVNALLDRYKKSITAPPKPTLGDDAKRRAAEAAGVNNSRTRAPAREASPKEKEAEAFDRVFGA